jgi:hypothetical protein
MEALMMVLARFLGAVFKGREQKTTPPVPTVAAPKNLVEVTGYVIPGEHEILSGEQEAWKFSLALKQQSELFHGQSSAKRLDLNDFRRMRKWLDDNADGNYLEQIGLMVELDQVRKYPMHVGERRFEELVAALSDAGVKMHMVGMTDAMFERLKRTVGYFVTDENLNSLRQYDPPHLGSYDDEERRFRERLKEYNFSLEHLGTTELELKQLRMRAYRLDALEALGRLRTNDGNLDFWRETWKSILARTGFIPQEVDEKITNA